MPVVEVQIPEERAIAEDAGAAEDAAGAADPWAARLAVRPLPGRAGFHRQDADSPHAVARAFGEATAAAEPRAVPHALRWLAEAEADPRGCDVAVTEAVLRLFVALPVPEAAPRLARLLRTLPVRVDAQDRDARSRLRLRDLAAMALANAAGGDAGGGDAGPGGLGGPEALVELEAALLDLSLTEHTRAVAAAALVDRGVEAGRVALLGAYQRYLDLIEAGKARNPSARDRIGRSVDEELRKRVEAGRDARGATNRTVWNNATTLLERMEIGRAPLEDLRAWAADPSFKQGGRRYEAVETLGDRGLPADVPLLLELAPWDSQRLENTVQARLIRERGQQAAQRIRQRLWREVALGRQQRGDFGAGPGIRVIADEPVFPDAFLDAPAADDLPRR